MQSPGSRRRGNVESGELHSPFAAQRKSGYTGNLQGRTRRARARPSRQTPRVELALERKIADGAKPVSRTGSAWMPLLAALRLLLWNPLPTIFLDRYIAL
jgi:hypothetical protein